MLLKDSIPFIRCMYTYKADVKQNPLSYLEPCNALGLGVWRWGDGDYAQTDAPNQMYGCRVLVKNKEKVEIEYAAVALA